MKRNEVTFRWRASRVWPEGREVRIQIDGCDLIALVHAWESDVAGKVGEANLAGAYAGIPEWYAEDLAAWRRGSVEDSALTYDGRVALLACGDCGEIGCWPLLARLELSEEVVIWHDFEQPYRRPAEPDPLNVDPTACPGGWGYEGFGPFVFDRGAYEEQLRRLMATASG